MSRLPMRIFLSRLHIHKNSIITRVQLNFLRLKLLLRILIQPWRCRAALYVIIPLRLLPASLDMRAMPRILSNIFFHAQLLKNIFQLRLKPLISLPFHKIIIFPVSRCLLQLGYFLFQSSDPPCLFLLSSLTGPRHVKFDLFMDHFFPLVYTVLSRVPLIFFLSTGRGQLLKLQTDWRILLVITQLDHSDSAPRLSRYIPEPASCFLSIRFSIILR